ncbi:hypothetical protein [Halopelagius longus]|uniref:DUF8151 domain-containing protein n=1 Tax=Halopelagius longus TaxID=1236180 RepID=A0A1H1D3A7_9EURY|nr:hypothetical protein [Halopelagius longus]RDI71147.1 hypothetical protein DWB78_05055 [Halopelagius longus]SDQ70920.1 hypothetical protein SAMN05216278_2206 [Halopelagius longus]
MTTALLELLPELLELLVYGTGSLGLSAAALYAESFAVATAQGGQPKLGAWAAVMGAVALSFAYLLATDKLRPKLTEVKGEFRGH